MKDIPIIFSGPMVRALIDGRKTMTRRVDVERWKKVPAGTRLWVRENWKPHSIYTNMKPREIPISDIFYAADNVYSPSNVPWRPSIFMPRWASRLTLIVESVKVEGLHQITNEDAESEGVSSDESGYFVEGLRSATHTNYSARETFKYLWRSIHGRNAWEENPLVAVISFRVIKANIDSEEARA